MTFRERLI
jgi:hypothetical protein